MGVNTATCSSSIIFLKPIATWGQEPFGVCAPRLPGGAYTSWVSGYCTLYLISLRSTTLRLARYQPTLWKPTTPCLPSLLAAPLADPQRKSVTVGGNFSFSSWCPQTVVVAVVRSASCRVDRFRDDAGTIWIAAESPRASFNVSRCEYLQYMCGSYYSVRLPTVELRTSGLCERCFSSGGGAGRGWDRPEKKNCSIHTPTLTCNGQPPPWHPPGRRT